MTNQKLISLTVTQFLQAVLSSKLTAKLDKLTYINFITNNHDPKLLEILLVDIDALIDEEQKQIEDRLNQAPQPPPGLSPVQLWQYQDSAYRNPQTKKSLSEISVLISETLKPLLETRYLVESILGEQRISQDVKNEGKRAMVTEFLKPLSGTWQNDKILSSEDFEELLNLATYLVESEKLPKVTLRVKRTKVSANFILYTFFLLYRKIYSGNNLEMRKTWLKMLKQIFEQLATFEDNTLYGIFSTRPPAYDQDLKSITF